MRAIVRCKNVGLLYPQAALASDEPPDFAGVFVKELAIPAGSFMAIVGASGSGKSTLLSLISGLKKPNFAADQAVLALDLANDRRLNLLNEEQPEPGDIGYIFQEPHLMKPLSAYLNYQAGGLVAGRNVTPDTFRSFVQQAGFKGEDPASLLTRTQIAALSGGQAQRIAVGRALAADPELLVCDEPTSSLDADTGRAILTMMRGWVSDHERTAVWVTHNLEQACEFADGFLITSQGRVFADGAQPFVFASAGLEDRRKMLEAKVASVAAVKAIGQDELMEIRLAKETATAAGPTEVVSCTQSRGAPAGRVKSRFSDRTVWSFLAQCVLADMFRGKATLAGGDLRGAEPSQGSRGRHAPWQHIRRMFDVVAGFNNWGMAIILLIGLIALYASLISWLALDRYFDRRLKDPEVSHFIIAGSGQRTNGVPLFSNRGLFNLQKDIKGYAIDGVQAPQVFGRRSNLIAQFGRARDSACLPRSRENEVSAEMLVASAEEPLYRNIFSVPASTNAGAAGDPVSAVVTEQFVNRLAPEDNATRPAGFCYYEFGETYVKIRGVVPALPGSGRFVHHVAFDDDTYLKLYRVHPPTSGFDENGRQRDPNYQTAAVYFDRTYAERLICEFMARKDDGAAARGQQAGQTCAGIAPRGGYVTNTDVLAQLSSLVGTANATRAIIVSVIVMFFALIVISTVFALNTFVLENEKFLSILLAFRYGLLHLLAIGWFQAIILLGITIVILVALLLLLDITAIPQLATRFDIPISWVALNPLLVLVSLGSVAAVAALIVLVVLSLWRYRNRYVGDKLQTI
jgi:ABC-type lipoprotein export system ATPase subunit